MKTLLKSLLVAFTLTLVTFSVSQADPNKPKKAASFRSGMYTTAEGKLQIALAKQAGGPVVVQLINPAGVEVFVQKIGKREQAVRLRLDVSALPDGIYQVAITNGVETTTQKVTLATQQPQVSAPPRLVALN